jgi:hypothetical protein
VALVIGLDPLDLRTQLFLQSDLHSEIGRKLIVCANTVSELRPQPVTFLDCLGSCGDRLHERRLAPVELLREPLDFALSPADHLAQFADLLLAAAQLREEIGLSCFAPGRLFADLVELTPKLLVHGLELGDLIAVSGPIGVRVLELLLELAPCCLMLLGL